MMECESDNDWFDVFLTRDDVEGGEQDYYLMGQSYLDAAHILHDNNLDESPMLMLLTHSFELFGKSFLYFKGMDAKRLKREVGHDLKKLVTSCRDRGLPIDKDLIKLTESLDIYKKHDRQRYPVLGTFTLGEVGYIEPNNIVSLIGKFSKTVHDHIKF